MQKLFQIEALLTSALLAGDSVSLRNYTNAARLQLQALIIELREEKNPASSAIMIGVHGNIRERDYKCTRISNREDDNE